jgi:inner membrane protein
MDLMDNVTHSLIGVVLGHLVIKAVPRRLDFQKSKKLILWTSILANNAPDIDVILPPVLGGGKLSRLLEHRGFTHTLLASPFLAALSLGVAWFLSAKPGPSRKQWFWLSALALSGVLLHLGADYCNDYGIHPFSPFQNRWLYGDFIFIIEPLIWFSILPLAFQESKNILLKGVVATLALGMIGILTLGEYVPHFVAAFAVLWFGMAAFWQWKVSDGKWLWVPSVSLLSVILTGFFSASQIVRGQLTQLIQAHQPDERIVQLVRTPAPADPLCWKALVVTEGPLDRYTVRAGSVSLYPKLVSAAGCQRGVEAVHTIPLLPVTLPTRTFSEAEISWSGEYQGKLSEISRLDREFCQFRALRKFARAPFWTTHEEGYFTAGDLRYDRSGRGGFSGVRFGAETENTPCPDFIPGWEAPVPLTGLNLGLNRQ